MTDDTSGGDAPVARAPQSDPAKAPPAVLAPVGGIPRGGGRSDPVTLAGILFIVAGLGGIAEYVTILWPNRFQAMGDGMAGAAISAMVVIVGSLGVLVGSVGAYVAFRRAGFPHRGRRMSFVTIGIAVCCAILPSGTFALAFFYESTWAPILGVIALIGFLLLLVFTIAAARNRMLPLGFRIVPVAQFVLVVLGYAASLWTTFPVTAVAFLGGGAAYIVLSAHARDALEAAAIATPDERRGRPSAAIPPPHLPQ